MKAEIITIGDELLIGQVVDTNSAYMAQRLNEWGIELYQITSVHDSREHILSAVDDALRHVDIVFTTGGLGPTKDDITKKVLCEYFDTDLVESPQVKAHVMELYKDRPQVLNRLTATQWMVPRSAEILENEIGSAPLMVFHREVKDSTSNQQTAKYLIALPGVPREMEWAMNGVIKNKVLSLNLSHDTIVHRTLFVQGIPESALAILIEDWENALPKNMKLAYLPKTEIRQICLRLSGYNATEENVETEFKKLLPIIHDYLVDTEDNWALLHKNH